jgi:hypothetical protein
MRAMRFAEEPQIGSRRQGPGALRCEQCDGLNPLKAAEVAGWFKGELRPPK